MKTHLEDMCRIIDDILAAHGLSAQVAGGYVTGCGILFSLTDTTFLNTQMQLELREALQVPTVRATVGVVLVNDWLPRRERQGTVIEGEYETVWSPMFEPVETIDVLDLILAHETEQKNGRILDEGYTSTAPQTKKTVVDTASSKMSFK